MRNRNLTEEPERQDERQRLQALERYHILDTQPEPDFDELVALAAAVCATPMAVMTLIDENRQWFKSNIGMPMDQTPRNIAFCAMVVEQRDFVVVHDAMSHPRFDLNPMVRGNPWIRFYAGAPLITRDGFVLGSLGVFDRTPRRLTPLQEQTLRVLAREIVAQLELRSSLERLQNALVEREDAERALQQERVALERKVDQRTAALQRMNQSLKDECARRAHEAAFSQAIIDSLPGMVYILEDHKRFVRWNRQLEKVSGFDARQIASAAPEDFFDRQEDRKSVAQCLERTMWGQHSTVEVDLATRYGTHIPYFFSSSRIDLDGHSYVCGLGVDITERRLAEESLRLRDRAVQASVNAIIITGLDGTIEYVNPAFERITGYSAAEAIGHTTGFLQREDRAQAGIAAMRRAMDERCECMVLVRNYRKNGELFWNDVHIAPVRGSDGAVTHFVGVLNDVTAIKHYERELERYESVDTLTALANRSVLHNRLVAAMRTTQDGPARFAVGFIDLDNFKFINESLGHNVGDDLLKRVAERLLTCLQPGDTIARYGGDEFCFVLAGSHDEKSAAERVEHILRTVDRPFQVGGHQLYISCSVGLSFFPRDGTDVHTLLKNADAALHLAKERGRNNFQFYTPAMNKRATERLAMEGKLRQAIGNDEFALHYQPKLDLGTGRIAGVEALLRWFPREGSMAPVPPAIFIPLAEEIGLINTIGEWVLYTACAHNKAMQGAGLPPLRVAVNLSARQFEPQSIVQLVQQALLNSGLEARYLELELTESMVMRNPEAAIEVLLKLKEMGLCLAIDDFGTGYSSLAYLQRFPVDLLKIDQSFVRDIGADPNDAIIARAVISLGHSLGKRVIAEGVSSSEQLSFLRENGCDEIQGYLFSPPLPFEELMLFLRTPERAALH